MDIIIKWDKVKIYRDNILKDIDFILSYKDQLNNDIREQAEELKKFLSNDNRLKESLQNEDIYRFLATASATMQMAKEELERDLDLENE